ncbi:P-loop containing nucleoside triphosphate hydrolase protein [Aspergillus carlsbadensis]|nr:P-loop containing nucleoside triphosphate hydrolase protein [Aspergillus carlsbadensis]
MTDIDLRYCVRQVPMKILMLGFPRTGTISLKTALERLGYHSVYHGFEALNVNPRDCEMWWAALQAKYHGKGELFGRKEFDRLLGHCQVVSDLPALCFAEDLIKAYPEAKVILTVRDVEKWHKSVSNSLMQQQENLPYIFWPMLMLDHVLRMPWRWSNLCMRKAKFILWGDDFQKNGRSALKKHYARIQSLVPADRLLLYHASEGWGPLCEFLGQAIPPFPVPRLNDAEMFHKKHFVRKMYHVIRYAARIAEVAAFMSLLILLGVVMH